MLPSFFTPVPFLHPAPAPNARVNTIRLLLEAIPTTDARFSPIDVYRSALDSLWSLGVNGDCIISLQLLSLFVRDLPSQAQAQPPGNRSLDFSNFDRIASRRAQRFSDLTSEPSISYRNGSRESYSLCARESCDIRDSHACVTPPPHHPSPSSVPLPSGLKGHHQKPSLKSYRRRATATSTPPPVAGR
jgi:hypothetical protein